MTTQCMPYCVTMVLYASATEQHNVIGNTQTLKKEAKYSMDSNNSPLWTGVEAVTSSKTLVRFKGTILSIVRNSMRSKLYSLLLVL